jgi:hypothetical protein
MLLRSDSIYHHYVYAGSWLTISTGVFIVLILVGMALAFPGGYPDPFAPYEGIMPGQPVQKLEVYGCHTESLESYLPSATCLLNYPEKTVFKGVQVFASEGIIWQITFFGGDLQVVDLIQHFGNPQTMSLKMASYTLGWDNRIFASVPLKARLFNHQLRVLSVTFKLLPDLHHT